MKFKKKYKNHFLIFQRNAVLELKEVKKKIIITQAPNLSPVQALAALKVNKSAYPTMVVDCLPHFFAGVKLPKNKIRIEEKVNATIKSEHYIDVEKNRITYFNSKGVILEDLDEDIDKIGKRVFVQGLDEESLYELDKSLFKKNYYFPRVFQLDGLIFHSCFNHYAGQLRNDYFNLVLYSNVEDHTQMSIIVYSKEGIEYAASLELMSFEELPHKLNLMLSQIEGSLKKNIDKLQVYSEPFYSQLKAKLEASYLAKSLTLLYEGLSPAVADSIDESVDAELIRQALPILDLMNKKS